MANGSSTMEIYHRADGSERIEGPRRLPVGFFLEETFGGWYEGNWQPTTPARPPRGKRVPLDPRKIGGRPAGS